MKTAGVLLLYASAALVACGGDKGSSQPNNVPHFNIPSTARKGSNSAQLTAGMVEAASQGKSQLPVQLKFDLPQRPTVGQPMVVNIAVMPQLDGSQGQILVSGGDGLTVAPDSSQIELPALVAGEVYRHSINLTPSAEGVLILNLAVSIKHDDATDSRSFSVPLIVDH